mmetsp:Transcript_17890/g.29390  ORF Transcript_17890/g.29390 Transcript_17890/m.29390 type:complete len:235 (-) Transcript_17890:115-819(-)
MQDGSDVVAPHHQRRQALMSIYSMARHILLTSFDAITNMLQNLPLKALIGLDVVWLRMCEACALAWQSNDLEVLEACTINMNIALKRNTDVALPSWVLPNHLQAIEASLSHTNETVRENGVRLTSTLALRTLDPHLKQRFGSALLATAESDQSLSVCCEALDCLFDVYGTTEAYDKNIGKLRISSRLQALLHSLKRKVAGIRSAAVVDDELLDRAEDILLNLKAFIAYMQERQM